MADINLTISITLNAKEADSMAFLFDLVATKKPQTLPQNKLTGLRMS